MHCATLNNVPLRFFCGWSQLQQHWRAYISGDAGRTKPLRICTSLYNIDSNTRTVVIVVTYCCSLGIGFFLVGGLQCAFIPATIWNQNPPIHLGRFFCLSLFPQFKSVYFMACYACYFVILFRLCSSFLLLLVVQFVVFVAAAGGGPC